MTFEDEIEGYICAYSDNDADKQDESDGLGDFVVGDKLLEVLFG